MRNTLLAAAALSALSTPGLAACLPPVAIFDLNKNTAEYISPDQARWNKIKEISGSPPGPGFVFTTVPGGRGTWNSRDETRMILSFLGEFEAFTYSGPEECRPDDLPTILPPEEFFPQDDPGRPIEDLFPDEASYSGPQSGLWKAVINQNQMRGCPAMMQSMFPQALGNLAAEWQEPRRLTFSRPFHPDQLALTRNFEAGMTTDVVWQSVGTNTWQAEIFPEVFGQIPRGQGEGSKMTWQLTVKSPSEIEHISTISIVLPAEAAAVMGLAGDCRVIGGGTWTRVGD